MARHEEGPRRAPSVMRFGPFEVGAVLGAGAMSTVYAGRHPVYGRVAIKVANELRFGHELRREHAILHRFQHPGIPRPLSYLEVVGRPTLVMTHLNGCPLDTARDRSQPQQLVSHLISLLAVLDHVHRRGVVHCDVKPQNVLTGRRAQLLDFGIARDIGEPSTDAKGRVAGTLAYMAPEVLEGREVSPQTDIYSMGVCLHRCLTGRYPFATDREVHLAAKRAATFVPPSVLRPELPLAVDELVTAMLQPEPRHRPSSNVLRMQLRELMPKLPNTKTPPSQSIALGEPGTTERMSLELG